MRYSRGIIQLALSAALAATCVIMAGCSGILSASPIRYEEKHEITSVKVFEPRVLSDTEESTPAESHDRGETIGKDYYRSKLDSSEQAIYDEILNGFMSFSSSIDITDCAPETAERCYKYVLYDIPEIFWVDTSYQYMITQDRSTVVSIQPDLIDNEESASKKTENIKAQSKMIVDSIPQDAVTDYDKAKYLFEQVADMLRYDEAMADFQDLGTVFDQKATVCGGYAKLYQYLCRESGIGCTYLVGYANVDGEEILHAWNMLDLDGTICYADATWGDKDEMLPVDFAWIGLTYDSIAASHRVLEEGIAITDANDPKYEIWAIDKTYYEVYDEQTVLAKMIESAGSGEPSLIMKFKSPEMFSMAKNFIKDNSYPATEIYERYPDDFPAAYTDGVYKAYEITDLNAIKIIWKH